MQSDVLVLITTQGVLLRPYCLIELWCALRFQVPIVIFDVAQRGFDWEEARTQGSHLPHVIHGSRTQHSMPIDGHAPSCATQAPHKTQKRIAHRQQLPAFELLQP